MAARRGGLTAAASVRAWEDDPGAPDERLAPVAVPAPRLGTRRLAVRIAGRAPDVRPYRVGSTGFRYWAAADALRRTADYWAAVVPAGTTWHPTNGPRLPVDLDAGEDLNAFYDRAGLHFFHATAGGRTVFSGESPNVISHELGHAVLDALRPQLWDVASVEAAAFHESFGDISALLAALQLRSFRQGVLEATGGRLYRVSRLSRLAEQLGWAIRQTRPDLVDADCLRNAVNSLFYHDPATLPPAGPAGTLTSEPHSFSRVFTAGFFQSLAGMYALVQSGETALAAVSGDAGAVVVDAVRTAPVVPAYFSQLAAHMIAADTRLFGGRYRDALQGGFVRHGVLSLQSAVVAALPDETADHTLPGEHLPWLSLPGAAYGLPEDLLVRAAAEEPRLSVRAAAPDLGGVEPDGDERAAATFVEDLLRRGKVDLGGAGDGVVKVVTPSSRQTHELRPATDGLRLVRRFYDCGFDAT